MIYFYTIHKLHCAACGARIEEAFLSLEGVEGASINIDTKRVRFESTKEYPIKELTAIAEGIEKGTYLEVWQDKGRQEIIHEEEAPGPGIPTMVLCSVLLVVGLIGEHVYHIEEKGAFWKWSMMLICFALPYILCGYSVLHEGWKSLIKKDFFNEFTLMSGATLAAIGIGHLEEAVGVMLFYCIGEFVQEKAAGNSRRSIHALLAAKPSIAHVCDINGNNSKDLAPEDVPLNAYVLVRPGEKIPLDGTVIEGTSEIDTAPLTGEPLPVLAEKGRHVFAGCINKDAALVIQVTALFTDTSVARILEMVESATARKAPTERFITRFAKYYTPGVVIVALLVFLLPPLFGAGSFSTWLYRALVLLVISCPCALLISIPLGYFGGIGAASRRGILVKGGYVLDALQHIRVAAFDKTGTLTHGTFSITQKHPAEGVSLDELTALAGLAESRSNHPLAKAIVKDALMRLGKLPLTLNLQVQEVPGKGVIATADADIILVGTQELLKDVSDLPSSDYFERIAATGHGHDASADENASYSGGSLALVAKNGKYMGCLVGADTLRPQAKEALEEMRKQGVSTLAMLTGDHQAGARAIAKDLPLDVIKSRLLPQDKATALQELAPEKETLFMGDGINDAPVLATAGIGVAMGGLGSEAAVETADVVILDDNPIRVPELLRIAKATRVIVWQNIIMALGIKFVFVILGIMGVSGLWEAVFADVGVALMAVLNASRAMRA